MRKITVFMAAACFAVAAHADRYDVYIHEQVQPNDAALRAGDAVVSTNNWGTSYAQGQSIRKAWDARKARKKHEQAMNELSSLDLNDRNAVMDFAKKYPESVDTLQNIIRLNGQLGN